jgi:putative transposase
VVEGHLMPDHVLMLLSIAPKYSVAQVAGYIKGKSALHIAQTFSGHTKDLTGQNLWIRGYWSPVDKDEKAVRDSIKIRQAEDLGLDL